MIEQLKPYAAYKDSGLPWLGRVPAHWSVLPHRTLFEEVKEREHPTEQMLSVTITRGVIKQRELLADSSKKDSSKLDKSAYKLVCPGDIAYNKMRAWQGAIGVSHLRGIISPAYVVQRLRDANSSNYYHHLFRTPDFAKEAERWSYGITSDMWSLRPEHFKLIYSPLPPAEEQATIVRFLDHATHQLDKAIRAKRKTIALLNEQKQAIIHRAVTRGLDPGVPLKDSGIPWLGQIPAHWKTLRLKSLVQRIDQGVSPQAENCLADGSAWGVVKAGCVNRGVFRELQHKRLPPGFEFDRSIAIGCGDVLVSRASGSPSLVGSVGRVDSLAYRLILSDKTFRPVFNQLVDVDFMVMAMNSHYYRLQVEQAISGADGLANNLPLTALKAFYFSVPSRDEQREIVIGLRSQISALLGPISRIEREAALLHEYRTRLIADVVTGKLDVREAAARLPESAPEATEEVNDAEVDEALDELTEEAA